MIPVVVVSEFVDVKAPVAIGVGCCGDDVWGSEVVVGCTIVAGAVVIAPIAPILTNATKIS